MKFTGFAAAALALGAIIPAPAAAEVGVLAAVNRDMTGQRPSETTRQIFLQEKLVANETIASSADGGGQVLFLDQTSLTVAPNSQIVLDKYVYDPNSQSGEMGLTVLKGAMRMVGGRITKKKPALIKTPSATIGIRGGIGSVTVRDDGTTIYMHIAGISSTISTDVGEITITREGGVATAEPNGEVAYQGVATTQTVQQVYGRKAAGTGDGGIGGEEGSDENGQQQQQQGDGREEVRRKSDSNIGTFEQRNSREPGARNEAPVSTEGERQTRQQGEQDVEVQRDPDQERSDGTINEIVNQIDQEIDQISISGTWAPSVDGAAAGPQSFDMAFSVRNGEGLVIVGLPEAVTGGANVETLAGDPVSADIFVVRGGDIRNLTPAPDATLLGGAAGGRLTIQQNLNVSGNVAIDYSSAQGVDAQAVAGQVGPTQGAPVDAIGGATVSEIVQGFRAATE